MQSKFIRKYEPSAQYKIYDIFLANAFKKARAETDLNKVTLEIKADYSKLADQSVERNGILVERIRKFKDLIKTKPEHLNNYTKLVKILKELKIIFEDVYDESLNFKNTDNAKFNIEDCLNSVHPEQKVRKFLESVILLELDNKESLALKNKLLEEIKTKIDNINWESFYNPSIIPQIEQYGSIVNTCSLKESDMDVTILTHDEVDERKLLNFIFKSTLSKIENQSGYKIDKLLTPNVRFPLIDVSKTTKQMNCKVSITINNELGVANSKLIETYMLISPHARILTLLMKIWTKVHKKTGAKLFYPTSYAYNLMIINFLQTIEPPILPSLQKLSKNQKILKVKRIIRDELQSFETRIDFEDSLTIIKDIMKERYSSSKLNVIELLEEFFKFVCYGHPEDYKFSIKDARRIPKETPDEYIFSLEDPFDSMHNPGLHLKSNTNQARDLIGAMKISLNLIRDEKIEDLFKTFD